MITRISEPHHDGSALYVSNPAPRIGDSVELRVRVPGDFEVDHIFLRIYQDGEARTLPLRLLEPVATESQSNPSDQWWAIEIEIINPKHLYRFALVHDRSYTWLTAAGVRGYEPNSNTDFVIVAEPCYPAWIASSIFYQIFPDRFATSKRERKLPEWAIKRDWSALPEGLGENTSREYFGGDFAGIESQLPYINELGITGIYLTPIFPALSTHRYDATSFDQVDPLLGGDKEFLQFLKHARKLKMKVMTDLTTNHIGAGHEWFRKALKNKSSKEHQYFIWEKAIPFGYVGWWGLASLPKLNFASKSLRKKLYGAKNSSLQRWLRAPFFLDGWRIDVGNMTGRYRDQDFHDEVIREIRSAFDSASPDGWLVAENADMIPSDLDGSGWHGTMNYLGFAKPIWAWINNKPDVRPGGQGFATEMPKISTEQCVTTLREYNGAIPWRNLLVSMNLLGSHDTARMRNVVGGDRALHIAAMALLLTYPGVPTIFAGDEIGLVGAWGEDARRTMPWEDQGSWDLEFLELTKELVSIRRHHDVLATGGLRFLEIADGHFIFARELPDAAIVVLIGRKKIMQSINPADYGFAQSEVIFSHDCAVIWSCK